MSIEKKVSLPIRGQEKNSVGEAVTLASADNNVIVLSFSRLNRRLTIHDSLWLINFTLIYRLAVSCKQPCAEYRYSVYL